MPTTPTPRPERSPAAPVVVLAVAARVLAACAASGNWYGFGFMLGISAVFSGPLSARRSIPARSRR